MKMYVIKCNSGGFLKKNMYGTDNVENVWEATLFRRKCDATNSRGMRGIKNSTETVEVEVRVKESN